MATMEAFHLSVLLARLVDLIAATILAIYQSTNQVYGVV
jgi:hypothetical protein